MRNNFLLLIGFALAACGCAEEDKAETVPAAAPAEIASDINTDPSGSYDEAYSAAVVAIDLAAARGHAWSVTDTLVKDAAVAAASGDEAGAILLADEARIQAQLAVIQADRETEAWRNNVISD